MEKQHEAVYHAHQPKRKIFMNNFVGGIGWGLGVTVGLSALLGITSFLLSRINFVPVIGHFTSEVVQFVQDNGPQRSKK